MIPRLSLTFLNHLLRQEAWARDRWRGFAGRGLAISLGGLPVLQAQLGPSGLLEPLEDGGQPDVTIRLPFPAPWELLAGPESLFARAHLEGPADLAEALGQVLRHLRWDVEGELAARIGDLAAHRLVTTGSRLWAWQKDTWQRLGLNVAEYLQDDSPYLADRAPAERLGLDIREVTAATDRLEQRLAAVEARQRGL